MTSLKIEENDIPNLTGKTALITGGASGIGFATALLLSRKHADVHILDLNPPSTSSVPPVEKPLPENITFHECDISDWSQLRKVFVEMRVVDYVFANAGILETENFLDEVYGDGDVNGSQKSNNIVESAGRKRKRHDSASPVPRKMKPNHAISCPTSSLQVDGSSQAQEPLLHLKEPTYPLFDVNLRGTLNTIKLAHYVMKRAGKGSIVITSSATAYAPEQSLPVFSALKLALVGLVRSLRNNLFHSSNITINAVVPAATETKLIAPEFVGPIRAAGLPMSSADFVSRALVFSAVARQLRKVEVYGNEPESDLEIEGPWNGRVILTLGNTYTELEEPLASLRPKWLGQQNLDLTKRQQAMTDFRNFKAKQ